MIFNLKHITLFLCFVTAFSDVQGQTKEKLDLNKGVDAYNKGDYGTAQEKFEKAYETNNSYNGALYNAANSAYRNGDFEKATEYYEQYAGTLDNKNDKAKAYHNLGNVYLKQDKLKESIDAYKNALRNNPNDEDTRYNLSYALSKLKKQQQQQDKDKKDDNENKDKKDEENKDKKDENQEKEDKKDGDKSDEEKEGDKEEKEGDGDKEEEKKNEEEKESDKPKPGDKDKGEEKEIEGKMSKGQIKKDLDAVNEDEKNILLKIAKQKGKKKGDNNTKDW